MDTQKLMSRSLGLLFLAVTVTNPARVVMLSPTTSSLELSGQDDYFFRIVQTMISQTHISARHIYQDRDIDRIAVIYDTDNAAYSKAYLKAFIDKYQSLGGKVTGEACFSSRTQPDFAPLVAPLKQSNPAGLLIIAADIDTALIAQRTRLMDFAIPLFTTSWAQTETLISKGGRAVEGLEIELISALNKPTSDYLDFSARYQERFGQSPSFGAVLSYDSARVLAAALKKTRGRAEGLPQALTGIKDFKGLSDTFSIDEYGDAVRPIHLGVIRDGKYRGISSPGPTGS